MLYYSELLADFVKAGERNVPNSYVPICSEGRVEKMEKKSLVKLFWNIEPDGNGLKGLKIIIKVIFIKICLGKPIFHKNSLKKYMVNFLKWFCP